MKKVAVLTVALMLIFLISSESIFAKQPVVGVSTGAMMPLGENIKDKFGMGIPFTVTAKVPELVMFGNMSLAAGLELGYYMASGENGGDDLSGIPLLVGGTLDLSPFLPVEGLMLGIEVNLGLNMQTVGDNSYTNIGLLPGICIGYNVMEGLNVVAKVRGAEFLSSEDDADFGGTQEWLDIRVGVEYALPVELPF